MHLYWLIAVPMIAVLVVTAPYWWRRGWWKLPDEGLAAQLRERMLLLQRDLEGIAFDRATGSLDAVEADRLQIQHQQEIQRLADRLAGLGGSVGAPPLPPAIRHDRRCSECGTMCQTGTRFCAHCGAVLRYAPVQRRSDPEAKAARDKVERLNSPWWMLSFGLLLMLSSKVVCAAPAVAPTVPANAVVRATSASSLLVHAPWIALGLCGVVSTLIGAQALILARRKPPSQLRMT
ncbi:MAG: zinc ribbon domain-containing protein [Deltaproteobacteria bacterium]|nr:zinc ribbon domain-containing protein [Deltaproteobacteria bacterium]